MLISGIVAGAATVYFLKSEKGKEMLDLIMDKGEEVKTKVSSQSKLILEEGKKVVNEAIEMSAEKLTETKSAMISAAEEVKENTVATVNDFQKGINKAKKELKEV